MQQSKEAFLEKYCVGVGVCVSKRGGKDEWRRTIT
jgi:hypothetical protein